MEAAVGFAIDNITAGVKPLAASSLISSVVSWIASITPLPSRSSSSSRVPAWNHSRSAGFAAVARTTAWVMREACCSAAVPLRVRHQNEPEKIPATPNTSGRRHERSKAESPPSDAPITAVCAGRRETW